MWPLSSLVFGVLREFDLPDCFRELAKEKRLKVIAPWDSQMRVWRADRLREHLRALGLERLSVMAPRRATSTN